MSPTKQEQAFEAAASPVDTLLTALKHAAKQLLDAKCSCHSSAYGEGEHQAHGKDCAGKKMTQRYYRCIAQVQKEQA